MLIQFAAVLTATTPYLRVLKFVDEVGEVMTLPFTSPAALSGVSFSPDGCAVIACESGSGTSVLHLWTRDSPYSDTWVEASIDDVPETMALYDVAFINDTDIAIVSIDRIFTGVLNRGTGEVTWSSALITSNRSGPRKIEVMPDRLLFIVTNSLGSSNAAGNDPCYWNGTAWERYTANLTDRVSSIRAITNNLAAQTRGTAQTFYGWCYDRTASPPTIITGGLNHIVSGTDIVPFDGPVADGVWIPRCAVSPDKETLIIPLFTSPYMAIRSVVDLRTPKYYLLPDHAALPSLPTYCNDLNTLAIGIILMAINSSTSGTGRVRGFRWNGLGEAMEEVTTVSDLFDDWSATPFRIQVSETFSGTAAGTHLYNTALDRIVNGEVDFSSVKLLLVNSDAAFDASHTTLTAAVGANEVTGSSWPAGGVDADTLTLVPVGSGPNVALTLSIPGVPMNDPGSFSFRSAILYDDADPDKAPLVFISWDTDQDVEQFDMATFTAAGNYLIVLDVPEV